MTDYTDRDTERARQAERSSAGTPTQNLGPLPQGSLATTRATGGRNNLAALALIGVGALILLGNLPDHRIEITGGMILLTIASCFLFFAFWKRIYGLLIPGCILAGLSLGVTFVNLTDGVSVLWGLALGFLALPFLSRTLFKVDSGWAIYPAVPLFAVGIIVAVANLPGLFAAGMIWLPLLLIGAGLCLGWGRNR
jgi:uncharacterized membrane protein